MRIQSINANLIFASLSRIFRVLPSVLRRKVAGVGTLLFANSLLDLLSLGAIVPLIPLVLDPAAFAHRPAIAAVYRALAFSSPAFFAVWAFFCVFALFALKNAANILILKRLTRFSYTLFHHFSTALHRLYFQRGFLFLRERSSPELVRDIAVVSARFSENLVLPLLILLNEAAVVGFLLLGTVLYEPRALLLLAAVLLPPFLIFFAKMKSRIQRLYEDVNDVGADLQRTLFQSVFGYADVKTTGSEEFFFRKYSEYARRYGELLSRSAVFTLIPSRILEVTLIFGVFLLVVYALFFVDAKSRIMLLGMFTVAAYRILPSINRMTTALLNIRGHQYTLDTVEQLRSGGALRAAASGTGRPLRFAKEVVFDSVSFRYPGKSDDSLRGISFRLFKGEALGIVGPSGAGKTTLLNVLLGFLLPSEGEIRIDGTPLSAETLPFWHRVLGYVQQEVYLIEGTVRENIAFGVETSGIDEALLRSAVVRSSLGPVIEALPEGIETQVGERGARFSVGQKQRIGIARALYSGAEVLFFDEATSALDEATEREISDLIKEVADRGLTVVIVAHRYSTLRHCHRILELETGRIRRESDYADLVARSAALR